MMESGACSSRITDQRLGCYRAVLFSHQCSQTSAGVWHHWPAKQVVCWEKGDWTRVYHIIWTSSLWMFEQMGSAWVRRLKASVAATCGFFEK